MDKNEDKKNNEVCEHDDCACPECLSGYHSMCGWHMGRGRKIIKIIALLLVVLFALGLGYGAGKIKGIKKCGGFGDDGFWYGRGMMGGNYDLMWRMMGGDYGTMREMMSGWRYGDDKKVGRVFGEITNTEGNKITISDNSGKEQTIMSLADTVIISSTGEIGLMDLGVGESVSVIGSVNKDGQFEAKIIRITEL